MAQRSRPSMRGGGRRVMGIAWRQRVVGFGAVMVYLAAPAAAQEAAVGATPVTNADSAGLSSAGTASRPE